jgi:hypothetical protein
MRNFWQTRKIPKNIVVPRASEYLEKRQKEIQKLKDEMWEEFWRIKKSALQQGNENE